MFDFPDQKTMYGGKAIGLGSPVFLFASEQSGGRGLIARGIVTAVEATPPRPDLKRQTPRVSVVVARRTTARHPLGRAELRDFRDWGDGRPETELNFMLYRQATDKIVGLTEMAATFLESLF